MASLRIHPPLRLSSPAPSEPWAQLNHDIEQYFDELEANASAPAGWFTPERASHLAVLLQRGQGLLAVKHWPHPEVPRQRALYAAHLRLLLDALLVLERDLAEVAERLHSEQQHVEAVQYWLGSQAADR